MRTTLSFGLARPKGSVSELEWQMFLRDEVTARFPDGLTVWEANGQWRRSDSRLRTRRIESAPAGSSGHRGRAFVRPARHRPVPLQKFEQESVLWETAQVCVAS